MPSQSADLGLGVCRATCSVEEALDARPSVALARLWLAVVDGALVGALGLERELAFGGATSAPSTRS
jgi:hypothetical protein